MSPYRGKIVVVDFWASWCKPCFKSFPWLNEMQAKYADDLVVLGINIDISAEDAEAFLTKVPAQFELVYDHLAEHASYYEVVGMPYTIIFDRQGEEIDRHVGFIESLVDQYEARIVEAIAAP